MNKIKNIAVFTSIRSEYGLLKSLIKAIEEDEYLNLTLAVGGSHLLEEYGKTIREIESDGFYVNYKLPFLFNDGEQDVAIRSMAALASQINNFLYNTKPDLLVVLGDRFELLPVVNASLVLNIPIAHFSGGEITEGAIDNQIRHAISKMAHLHFVATEEFKNNLLKMGEESWRICVSGELGLDEVLNMKYLEKAELFENLGLDPSLQVICATLHSETIGNEITPVFVEKLYKELLNIYDIQILVTAANFDIGGQEINKVVENIAEQNPRLHYVKSLGKFRYFSLLKHSLMVLGNSSSGLVEVQSFNIPSINIGKRQQGRLSNPNVIHVPSQIKNIIDAVEFSQTNNFRELYYNKRNIYGKGDSVGTAIDFIKGVDTNNLLLKRTVF